VLGIQEEDSKRRAFYTRFWVSFFVGIGLLLSSGSLFYGISCELSLVIYDVTLVYRLVTCYAKVGYLRLVIYGFSLLDSLAVRGNPAPAWNAIS
jgi:hypothetical protein